MKPMNKEKFILIDKYVNKIFMGIFIILLVVFAVVSFLENRSLERQIEQRDDMIKNRLKKDSIQDMLVPQTVTEDGYLIYTYRVNSQTSKPFTYHEWDSLYSVSKKELYIKDAVLVAAKRYYQFNYSYIVTGDSVVMKFWDK